VLKKGIALLGVGVENAGEGGAGTSWTRSKGKKFFARSLQRAQNSVPLMKTEGKKFIREGRVECFLRGLEEEWTIKKTN